MDMLKRYKLKSDQNGIEIRRGRRILVILQMLKSDQNGIEMTELIEEGEHRIHC